MSEWINFCCPQCRGPLTSTVEAYRCAKCRRDYPIVFGLPDFRLSPDPYISFRDEYEKAGVLAEKFKQLSFEALLKFYWDITQDAPRAAAERYVRYALSAEERGKAYLESIDGYAGSRWTGEKCLEIGCGTGGFLLAAQSRFRAVVGADIALRWLIIAKKRVEGRGDRVVLVCCSAEHLPFSAETFDGVVGIHLLEHTKDQNAVISETARTLKQRGLYFLSTANRFTLGPEPCVHIWGVGFLPRCVARRYVWLVKGIPYRHIRLLSLFELRRLLSRAGLRERMISAPRISECEQKLVSGFTRCLISVYHAVREFPGFSFLLQIFGPFLQVLGRKQTSRAV